MSKIKELPEPLKKMLYAQKKAEFMGEHDFTCPLCQGKAKWARAAGNDHLWIQCHDCGFRLVE